ncbi:protein adenylyltransferase SelO [Pelagicoccus mobilis]|uniref:Protein nucleotidyltransferase YdiU n=1 Tax=Pelagicoccus mobilis TaxID=415221 RepID=A0A934S141_9BACT|nr:YdiU family protein [Pelagicoccus mobilis]MBK1877524.1 YdiU family protein [Pelagicoccus mobilis]
MSLPFDNTYTKLPARFYARQTPSPVPSPKLLKFNHALAKQLSIPENWPSTPEALAALSGNGIPDGSEPIAQAYAGHQFGHFVPQLGDGRALLLGELKAKNGQRYDIQLKGSGQTAFSRNGDGKSALGPVIREYILSEAMSALGVPSTRALAAVETGETVWRQEGEVPGGVFTRVAASHIRVGTFQYFYARNDVEGLKHLAEYTIDRHYPKAGESEAPYLELLKSVVEAQARLIPHWMSLGFIHGVMNTDNCAVSGETIDYGPCAFMEAFHPNCVFSSIDQNSRYAWGNQGNIALWNLTRFAETLLPLVNDDPAKAAPKAEKELERFPNLFAEQYAERFKTKLALPESAPDTVIKECLQLLAKNEIDFTLFFRRLTELASGGNSSNVESLFEDPDKFVQWRNEWQKHADIEGLLETMKSSNPIRIPRNHRVEQAIQAAYQSDYSPFNRLVVALKKPYSESDDFADLESLPLPHEIVHQTFCGT